MSEDAHSGVGGSYTFDPATGVRTRVGGQPLANAAACACKQVAPESPATEDEAAAETQD